MKTFIRRSALVFGAIALSACTTLMPPERPVYTGADSVAEVDAAMLVGDWILRVLNPVEGSLRGETLVSYKDDGTMVVNTSPIESNAAGAMAFEVSGVWHVAGDFVVQEPQNLRETTGNPLGRVMTMVAAPLQKSFTGKANIYEATVNRVVLVGELGEAQELIRR